MKKKQALVKFSSFVDDMIVYIEKLKEYAEVQWKLLNVFIRLQDASK